MNKTYKDHTRVNVTYFIFILLIPLTLPDYLLQFNIIENLSVVFTIFIFLIFIFLTIINKRFNFILLIIFIYFVWRSSVSYFYSEEVLDLTNSLKIITLVLFINLIIDKYPKSTLSALSSLFSIYIYINLMSIYVFPNGLYIFERGSVGTSEAWFLGIANQFAYVLIPGLTFIILNTYYRYKKVKIFTWITIAAAFLTLIKVWSATGLVSLFVIITFTVFVTFKIKIKHINFNFITTLYILLFIGVLNIQKISPVKFLVVDVLKKDLTLSFRTVIWEKVLSTIDKSIMFGHGINTYVLAGEVTSFAAHNLLLQITLDSGLIGVLIFLVAIFSSGRKLQLNKSQFISFIILSGIFAILIGGLAESYRTTYLFTLLVLGYNVNKIILSFNEKHNKVNN